MNERRLAESLLYAWSASHDDEDWIMPIVMSVSDVNAEKASSKPSKDVASIHELMAHAVAYTEGLAAVLAGQKPKDHDDWPTVNSKEWPELVSRLSAAHESVKSRLETITDEELLQTPAGRQKPLYRSVLDIAVHDAYHAGQVVKLRQIQEATA